MLGFVAAAIAMQASQTISVNVDPRSTRDEINPYIYGQFIEHLGRCIYGGIWAEMLEDRKFYHPITKTYDPYTSLKDTDYPVVGRSPWEIVAGNVEMSKINPFVGDHSPILIAGTTVRQHKLGVEAGKQYVGYIWLRASSGKPVVKVSMGEESFSFTPKATYSKFEYRFTAASTTDDAKLTLNVLGGDAEVGTLSLMPADNVRGMRKDTLALLKQMGGTIYRWPGGNFVSGYDWRDGIGDRDKRPPRKNPAWTGVEHNDFGTDEFIDFCKTIGADPLVTVNTGFGDAYTAAQWVEYCNGTSKTIGGSWRVKNGHRNPYAVKNWCVGNEMWGDWQLGYMRPQHYTIKHNWVADAMLKADPSLVLIGSGDLGNPDGEDKDLRAASFTKHLLERSGKHMDMISEHFYSGRLPWTQAKRFPLEQAVKQMAVEVKAKADGHRKLQAKTRKINGKTVWIAMDEWNYWHREYKYGELGCEYDMADALGVAAGLHEFFRNTDIIKVATYAQTVNVIGALKTSRTKAELESTGLVLQVYRHHYGSIPVQIEGNFGGLDIEAALTADKKSLTIGFVNPTNEAIELAPSKGKTAEATVHFITGKDEFAKNGPGKPRQVDIGSKRGTTVPPLSCGVIVLPL